MGAMSLVNVTSRAEARACSLLSNAHAASMRNKIGVLERMILEIILLLLSRAGLYNWLMLVTTAMNIKENSRPPGRRELL